MIYTSFRLAVGVLLIVLLTADVPQVRVHRLLAVGKILLRLEVDLVLRDRHQVSFTSLHSRTNCGEASACVELFGARLRRALVRTYHVQPRTNGVGRRRYAVRCQQRVTVITVHLARLRAFGQKAGYVLNTLSPFYFCHSRSAIGV